MHFNKTSNPRSSRREQCLFRHKQDDLHEKKWQREREIELAETVASAGEAHGVREMALSEKARRVKEEQQTHEATLGQEVGRVKWAKPIGVARNSMRSTTQQTSSVACVRWKNEVMRERRTNPRHPRMRHAKWWHAKRWNAIRQTVLWKINQCGGKTFQTVKLKGECPSHTTEGFEG